MDQSRRSCLLSVATLGIALCLGLVCVAGATLGYFMLDPELPFPLAGDEPTSTPGRTSS